MAKKRGPVPFHLTVPGIEIHIEDSEAHPGLVDKILTAVSRAFGRNESVPLIETKPRTIQQLSPRERTVARLVAAGHSTKEIAGSLGISENTINSHRANIRQKVGTSSVDGLKAYREQWDTD